MNNPTVVTERSLAYYDSKIKAYGSATFGSDMSIEWEPMEDGRNPFKLKIALKNGNGSELFVKTVDFPLEQTIVSGSYEKETKSLLLYFQDGTSTKIPIGDLIDGLASRLDLDKKADKGEINKVSTASYRISVPQGSAPYAKISKIGGASYRSKNLLKADAYYMGTVNGLTATLNADGTVTINGTASAQTDFFLTTDKYLPVGNYTFKCDNSGMGWNSYWGVVYSITQGKIIGYDTGAGVAFTSSGETLQIQITVGSGKAVNNVVFKPMINAGSTALPFEPYFEGLRDIKVTRVKSVGANFEHTLVIPESVQSLEGYGQGNPDNPLEYNYLDLDASQYVCVGKVTDGAWAPYEAPQVTDVSIDGIIAVENGGTLTLENEQGYGVPAEISFYPHTNGHISASFLVGELMGVSEGAKRSLTDTGLSELTIDSAITDIKERLTRAEANAIRVTKAQLSALSYVGATAHTPKSNVVNPEGVSVNELVIDKYVSDGSAYLCFWQITGFTSDTLDLKGLGCIYVGGGSASVADKAVMDGEGRIITQTYAERSHVEALDTAQTEMAERLDTADTERNALAIRMTKAEGEAVTEISAEWENEAAYILKMSLKKADGSEISSNSIDLPLESMVVGATYDGDEQTLVLELKNGTVSPVPVADIFKGLVTDTNIGEKKAGSASEADYAKKATGFIRGDGTEATVESVEVKAVAAGERANSAYSLAAEAKEHASSFDEGKASQSEVDALSKAQADFEKDIKDGTVQAHTAKYAPGNTSYTLENAIRNITLSGGKLSLIRFNASQGTVNLLSEDFINTLSSALASDSTFINTVVDAVLKEMGY